MKELLSQLNLLKSKNETLYIQLEENKRKMTLMTNQMQEMSQEKEKARRESQMNNQSNYLGIVKENQELRKMVQYYKEQYRNRQAELTQLLDENSKLYSKLQR